MSKQSFKSKAINAVISAIVRTLLGWAEEWSEDAFFFLVIGDKTCTDVAWHNTEDLSCDGALAITQYVESASAFQDLATSVDVLINGRLEEDEFRKAFEKTYPQKDKQGWCSLENIHENQKQKGGAQ